MKVQRPKCSLCEKEAVISLPYARLRLCKEHFEKYMIKRIKKIDIPSKLLVGLSGGKDSITMTYLLKRIGLDVVTVTVNSVPKYTEVEARVARKVAEELDVPHLVIHAKELYGFTALSHKAFRRAPCSLCSTLRRHALDLVGQRLGFRYLATGHNMDDVLQTALTSLIFGSVNTLRKATPVEPPIPGSLGRVKPLFWLPERDVLAFALTMKLPWLKIRCPLYQVGRLHADLVRNFMHDLEEEKPSSKIRVLKNLLEIGEMIGNKEKLYGDERVRLCKFCNLISYSEICSVCKLRMRAKTFKISEKPQDPVIDVLGTRGNVAVIGHGWVKWIEVELKRSTRISKLLMSIGLNKEKAVVVDENGVPLPYEATISGDIGRGEMKVYVVTRVPPKVVRSFVP